VQHFARFHAQLPAGGVEDRRVGLGVAGFARGDGDRELVRDADRLQVGVAGG